MAWFDCTVIADCHMVKSAYKPSGSSGGANLSRFLSHDFLFLLYFVDGAIEWDYYYARSALTDGDQFGIEETKVRNRTVQWRKF